MAGKASAAALVRRNRRRSMASSFIWAEGESDTRAGVYTSLNRFATIPAQRPIVAAGKPAR